MFDWVLNAPLILSALFDMYMGRKQKPDFQACFVIHMSFMWKLKNEFKTNYITQRLYIASKLI